MFRVCACNNHSNTHVILALNITREPTVWGCMTSEYTCTHDTGRPTRRLVLSNQLDAVAVALHGSHVVELSPDSTGAAHARQTTLIPTPQHSFTTLISKPRHKMILI